MSCRDLFALIFLFVCPHLKASTIAITIDDLTTSDSLTMSSEERTMKILSSLKSHGIKTTMFVCGMRVDSKRGSALLTMWDSSGHALGNHTYSHHYYHSKNISLEDFKSDFSKAETVISQLSNFTKIFRFPYLKHGNTKKKRDGFRDYLSSKSYRNGYVTVDASDWYISQRMQKKLQTDPDFDLSKYRIYYLKHIWDRAQYYDALSKKLLKRDVAHTLIIHDNLLNAFFLGDLIQMFKDKNWKVVDSKQAFKDPIYDKRPNILPAGESVVWALAKEAGEDGLRYPAEDGRYQEKEMDQLGL